MIYIEHLIKYKKLFLLLQYKAEIKEQILSAFMKTPTIPEHLLVPFRTCH